MILNEIISVLEEIAPPAIAMPVDPIGLQIGDPLADI